MKSIKLLIGISAFVGNYAFAQISEQVDSIKQLKEIIITYQANPYNFSEHKFKRPQNKINRPRTFVLAF